MNCPEGRLTAPTEHRLDESWNYDRGGALMWVPVTTI